MTSLMGGMVGVLEDDRDIADIVSNGLNEDGFEVMLFRSVEEFELGFHRNSFDLLLVDVSLPDGNGMDVVRDVKSRTSAGIIFVTGRGDEIDQVLGFELGADDFVVKPFRIRELRARAKALYRRLKQVRGGSPAVVRGVQSLHGLEIVRESRLVKRTDGEVVDLTPLEFDVLSILASCLNRTLSRPQVMDKIRGPEWNADGRSIDGLVSRLRSKLFPDGTGSRKIRTVRGVGYMMVSD